MHSFVGGCCIFSLLMEAGGGGSGMLGAYVACSSSMCEMWTWPACLLFLVSRSGPECFPSGAVFCCRNKS